MNYLNISIIVLLAFLVLLKVVTKIPLKLDSKYTNTIIFLFISLSLIYIQQRYYVGMNYSYVFEIIILFLLALFTFIYKENKYRNKFFFILAMYVILRLAYKFKTTSIEKLINNYNLNENDKVTYDLLIEKDNNICELSGSFNDDHGQKLTLEIGENSNYEVCKQLIEGYNLDFVAEWEKPINYLHEKGSSESEKCDYNWYSKFFDEVVDEIPIISPNKDSWCKYGLICNEYSKCEKVSKRITVE